MKALISPNESPIQHIVAWVDKKPVYENYPNSCRVAQVESNSFEVAPPLFWVDCADDVVANKFYYDTENQEIYPIVNEPLPN
jgi:hypothetical protein